MSLEITGLNRLKKLCNQFPAVTEKYANKAIAKAMVRILGEEKREAPFGVSGLLRDNWLITNGRFTGKLASNAPYAADVEYGTLPHHVSGTALIPWANKKGLNPWAVAHSIARKGTKANPFFHRAIESAAPHIQDDFKDAFDDAMKELASMSDA